MIAFPIGTKGFLQLMAGAFVSLLGCSIFNAAAATEQNPYMGAPVTLEKAPNGAIANKKILDGINKVGWLEPTIGKPAKGIWVLGGYGLAPMTIY